MSDKPKTTDLKTIEDALDLIQRAEPTTVRFVLATLVVSEAVTLDAFQDALRIGRHPRGPL